jgi:transcriptional regulator with XRE-family HTH domain
MTPAAFRAAREALGLTQVQLGQALGVTGQYVSDIERGQRSPSKTLVMMLERLVKDAALPSADASRGA